MAFIVFLIFYFIFNKRYLGIIGSSVTRVNQSDLFE